MLVTMKEILDKAKEGKYGVTAPNIIDYRTIDACLKAAVNMNSPVILDATFERDFDMKTFISYAAKKAEEVNVPVAINLDHGGPYEDIIKALAMDYTSVMVDRSSKPFQQNVDEVKEIVKIAHALGKSVEAELGHVGSNLGSLSDATGESAVIATKQDRLATLTKVDEAVEYVKQTGIDALAVAIGTVHGLYPQGLDPEIEFDLLQELKEAIDVPLVVHGGSGTGDENLTRMCKEGICKVNLCNDLVVEGRKYIAEGYEYKTDNLGQKLIAPIPSFYQGYQDKLEHYMRVLGCEGKASR